ncbi:hypothetical protein BSKO_10471 [Bryopsis sp. KO-2023]|nr:hypothetical protein BSKO_10471 [Bryopsis sp. KO-2023]
MPTKQGLLDLEWEVVLKILAFSGSKAICNAAATCTTLNKMKAHLSTVPLFSSTMNNGTVETALKNAMDGMLGSIDFAFIAMQGNAKRDEVLEGIRKAGLPKSCQIIGGKAYYGGSIGLIDGTIPWEIESDPPFVSVLLGRVPDRRVEAMDCREKGECGWNDECDFVIVFNGGGATDIYLANKKEKCAVVGGLAKSTFHGDINEIKTRGSPVALCFSPYEGETVNSDEQRSESQKARAEKGKEGDAFSPHVFGVSGLGHTEKSPIFHGCLLKQAESSGYTRFDLSGGISSDGRKLTDMLSRPEFSPSWSLERSIGLWRQTEGRDKSIHDESDPYVVMEIEHGHFWNVRGDARDVEFRFEENLSAILLERTKEISKKVLTRQLADIFSKKLAAQSKHTDIYGILERSAKSTKTGPSATIIFACSERGENFFEEPNVESSLVDEIAKGKMPIAGLFVGGEFGPDLRGWASANSETAKRYCRTGFTTMFAVL